LSIENVIRGFASRLKEKLVEIIKGLLGTDADLNFLVKLDENELETLVACIKGIGLNRLGNSC